MGKRAPPDSEAPSSAASLDGAHDAHREVINLTCSWCSKLSNRAHGEAQCDPEQGEPLLFNGKRRHGELICIKCNESPPCTSAKGCWCVQGQCGSKDCPMHKLRPAAVVMTPGNICSNCTHDRKMNTRAQRERQKIARTTVSDNERRLRTRIGLKPNRTLEEKKRERITWAHATALQWDELWYYYVKWRGGIPKDHNQEKWGARMDKLAEKIGIFAEPFRRGTAGHFTRRLYDFLDGQRTTLLVSRFREYPGSKNDHTINFAALCGTQWI